jgi:hypothetical protein
MTVNFQKRHAALQSIVKKRTQLDTGLGMFEDGFKQAYVERSDPDIGMSEADRFKHALCSVEPSDPDKGMFEDVGFKQACV